MRNVTFLLEHLPIDEWMLGLIDGSAMTASLFVVTNSRRQSLLLVILVILLGCGTLIAWEGRPNHDRMFILALLVSLCRLGASLARRFTIADLMWLTTAVAVGIFFVQRTGLIHRDAVYWVGTVTFSITIALVVSSRHWGDRVYTTGLFAVAILATIGFAAADAHWVQPDRLEFQAAIVRYAAFLFGMITPPLFYRMCRHAVALKPKIHERVQASPGHAIPRTVSNDEPSGTSVVAASPVESTLRVVGTPSALCPRTR